MAEQGADGAPSASLRAGDGQPVERTVGGLTRAEIEAAAIEGRQIAGHLDKETAFRLLREGELSVVGRLMAASNATFLCVVRGPAARPDRRWQPAASTSRSAASGPCTTSPTALSHAGKSRPMPVSEASGWEVIPPTVLRDGPLGEGMVQLWVEVDESVDLAELIRSDNPALRRMAVLDAILNNADRKGGHLLPLPDGRDSGLRQRSVLCSGAQVAHRPLALARPAPHR